MSVFDFSNYRSPSEARALEAQAFAERQLGSALANKRANTLALAQTAIQSDAQRNLEGYRTDNLNFQIGASARADQDRDREFGLRERQDKRAEDRYAAQMDAFKQQQAMEVAQKLANQQGLDAVYKKLENQKQALLNEKGSGIFEFDSTANARRKSQADLIERQQEELYLNYYYPEGLTPLASFQQMNQPGGTQQSQPLNQPQAKPSSKTQQPQAKPPAFSGFTPSPAANQTANPTAQPVAQPALVQREASIPTGALAIPQGSGSYNPFMGRGLSANPTPPSAGPIPYNAPTGALSAPKMAGDYNPFTGSTIAIKPPTKSKMQSALSAMADMYEQQGMAPEEALGQAYKDARTNSDLFRKTLSQ